MPARSADRSSESIRHLARVAFLAFLLTFITARVLVFLIMARRIPDLFLHVGGTHVHHLNYGIFLLSGVGAYLLFARPAARALEVSCVAYAVGLGLTFDEFGMWLHLGGGYWQRASFDAVVVIASTLGIIAFAPRFDRFRPRNWFTAGVVVVALLAFAIGLRQSFRHVGEEVGPRLRQLDAESPR